MPPGMPQPFSCPRQSEGVPNQSWSGYRIDFSHQGHRLAFPDSLPDRFKNNAPFAVAVKIDDLVMDEEQLRNYTFDRKLCPDSIRRERQLSGLKRIIVHNGEETQEVIDQLKSAGLQPEERIYFPKESSEAHIYIPVLNDLHVVNCRGPIRRIREEQLAEALEHLLQRRIILDNVHYQNDPAKATKRFEDLASRSVIDLVSKIDRSRVRADRSIDIVFGPYKSLRLAPREIIYEMDKDYLNYKLLQIGDRQVLSFDYIFGDQARNVLHQTYATLGSYFDDLVVNVFHYGKIGLLDDDLKVGDICIPAGAMEESQIHKGDDSVYPIRNQFVMNHGMYRRLCDLVGQEVSQGVTVNTISVIRQTKSGLRKDLEAGGNFLDMEWSTMAGLFNGFKSNYPGIDTINHFFAGVGSDKPLHGRTLGDTKYPREQEVRIADAYKRIILEGYHLL